MYIYVYLYTYIHTYIYIYKMNLYEYAYMYIYIFILAEGIMRNDITSGLNSDAILFSNPRLKPPNSRPHYHRGLY